MSEKLKGKSRRCHRARPKSIEAQPSRFIWPLRACCRRRELLLLHSSKEGGERVVAEITRKGRKAVAVQANVAKPADVQRLFAETKKAFGPLDVLVNNAGIYEFARWQR